MRGLRVALICCVGIGLVSRDTVLAGNPDLYDYSVPASFLTAIEIELDGRVGEDLTGDGVPDNALGEFLASISLLAPEFDPNPPLADSIAAGSVAVGLAWQGVDGDLSNDTELTVDVLRLVDVDGNPSTRSEYRVDRDSFLADTAEPVARFADGRTEGGQLAAGPAAFRIDLIFADTVFPVVVEQARLRGRVSEDALGIALAEGSLAGFVSLQTLYLGFNALVGPESCPCLSPDEPLIDPQTGQCNGPFDTSACGPADATCVQVAQFCILLVQTLRNAADFDLDGDGELDALSAYLRLEGQGTRLLGPEGPADCNENGIPDDQDIRNGTSMDVNGDGVPDECRSPGVAFHRGDPDDNGRSELTDGIVIFRFLFQGTATPTCLESADTDNSGRVELTDGIALLQFLFRNGPQPQPPGPPTQPCGLDPDGAGSPADIGCSSYQSCGV